MLEIGSARFYGGDPTTGHFYFAVFVWGLEVRMDDFCLLLGTLNGFILAKYHFYCYLFNHLPHSSMLSIMFLYDLAHKLVVLQR